MPTSAAAHNCHNRPGGPGADPGSAMSQRQVTTTAEGHLLTNANVWSPDGRWLVYDVRSSPDGSVFDGRRIERVEVETGRVEVLYEAAGLAACGVVTTCPTDDRVVFIRGPERPSPDWRYGPARREGVVVRASRPGVGEVLDARDLAAPYTPGALRGGSHVHVFSPDGRLVSFTYEDAVLDAATAAGCERNLRGVAVSLCDRRVVVPRTHARNHDGSAYSVLLTRLSDTPRPGSDEISRACEEGWIGARGYVRADGSHCRHALAFQGTVTTAAGATLSEVFIVELPDDLGRLQTPGDGPLAGTATTRPRPPSGVVQRRITFTADRAFPGLQGPRHWLRSDPTGERIACLMRDQAGVVQLWSVSPRGGPPAQITRDPWDVASAFTWCPEGRRIAYVGDGSVMTVDVATGSSARLTPRVADATGPRPEACVFSPDGRRIAYLRTLRHAAGGRFNQLFVAEA